LQSKNITIIASIKSGRLMHAWIVIAVLLIASLGCISAEKQEVIYVEEISLSSTAFENNGAIPAKHTCDGENVSPALSWGSLPHGTKSLALILDDLDAPMGTWVHWVLYNVPKNKTGLPEGVPKDELLEDGSLQGITDFRRPGYGGPCPPPGRPHRYYFKLYVLDTTLDLPAGSTKQELERAMNGHILARGELMGKYGR
jgi:Raf kinase inhibitor-like YbhB/YbcL family protein